ncbi:hypothetical protein E2493_19210 [Sphingomonas parva]|uniref:Serine protease n=1 Tax=Sphingomonas parva TaxID=2555898 RepID=A0A4Y8ZKV9_9SPHN|nr:hypothetical protein [Sphingomonas parva]TFI56641.1 hypothetical protein E2493_19210 [Sphingomonas parva]
MASRNDRNEVQSHSLVTEDARTAMAEAADYWTEQRMAEAQPVPVEISDDARRQMEEESPEPEGERADQPSAAPEDGGAFAGFGDDEVDLASYTTTKVPNRRILPYCTVGKLFMRFGNSNYVGSAWSIARRAVFTAGHCIFDRDTGGWARTVLFVPQYHQGAEPVGRWAATRMHSLIGWTRDRDFRYDMGVFEVDRAIGPTTGTLGWMANYPPNQGPYTSIGYPAAPPFNGQEMWQSVGAYINGSNPIQMHNNMTGGCSGGPWAVVKGGQVYANGLNSFRYNSNPNTMYSPYFGQGLINLYNLVKNLT